MALHKEHSEGRLTSFEIPGCRTVLIDNRTGHEPADAVILTLAKRGTEEGYTVISDFLSTDRPDDHHAPVPHTNISILLRPGKHADLAGVIAAMGAVAASHAIERNSDYKTQLCWLGGIYAEKKCIGEIYSKCTLLPTGYLDYMILSATIELPPARFPTRMNDIVTRVFTSRQIGVEDHVAQTMVHDFFLMYDDMKRKEGTFDLAFWEEYRRRSFLLGKRVRVLAGGKKRTGVATAIENDGRLTVTFKDGTDVKLASQTHLLSFKVPR